MGCIKRKYDYHGYDEADAETEREAEEREFNKEYGWLEEQERIKEQELKEETRELEERERIEEKRFQEGGGFRVEEEDVDFEYSDEEIEGEY